MRLIVSFLCLVIFPNVSLVAEASDRNIWAPIASSQSGVWSIRCYYQPRDEFASKYTKPARYCNVTNGNADYGVFEDFGFRISGGLEEKSFEEIGYRKNGSDTGCHPGPGGISFDRKLHKGEYITDSRLYAKVVNSSEIGVQLGLVEWPSCIPRTIVTRIPTSGLRELIKFGFEHLSQPIDPALLE